MTPEPSAPSLAPSVGLSLLPQPTPDPSLRLMTLLAAGDIASCDSDGDEATAELLDELFVLDSSILALGDLAYEDGSARDFARCYDPSWGRHRDRTRPAIGNHEYDTDGAAAYFEYFGAAAGKPDEGWYSWDLREWHLIALNSNCEQVGGCGPESPQVAWLTEDLATHQKECTLAYWHHPRWSSGDRHGSDAITDTLWRVLYDAGAEMVLSGHDHQYERLGPMDADGTADPGGMVQFVVGTGGRSLYHFDELLPTSAAHDNSTFGMLRVTLRDGAYDWQFVPTTEGGFTDAGSATCH